MFVTPDEWLAWLRDNYDTSGSIWIKFAKKGAETVTINYVQAREGALIYGWIDGLINKYDDQFYLTRFSPRKAKSAWSKINRDIVEGLIEAGRMQPSGLAQVEAAKRDGRWDAAYASPSKMEVPDDFAAQLALHPEAKTFFESLNKANRYAFLYRIETAKTPAARARQLEKAIEKLTTGTAHYPQN